MTAIKEKMQYSIKTIIAFAAVLFITGRATFAQAGDWKTREYKDACISVETPFELNKEDTGTNPPFMKKSTAYSFTSAKFNVGLYYVDFADNFKGDINSLMHNSVHRIVTAISGIGLLQNFSLSVDTLYENGTYIRKVKGEYVVDGVKGEFYSAFYKRGAQFWGVSIMYMNISDEYRKLAQRILESVKIKDE